jgi:hypothetical protein
LERYELDVFAEEITETEEPVAVKAAVANSALEKAAARVGRRKAAAQASLFDLANQKVIEDVRNAPESITAEEARDLLLKLRNQLM